MKKYLKFLIPLPLVLIIILLQYQHKNKMGPLKDIQEKELQEIKKQVTTLPVKNNRSPASIPSKRQAPKILPRPINMRSLLNSPPSSNWEKKLAQNLLKFQSKTTQVFFKKKGIYKKIIKGKEKILQKVQITMKFKDGNKNSYHSLVDTKNGQILQTWDRTIHENKKLGSFKMIPTGSL